MCRNDPEENVHGDFSEAICLVSLSISCTVCRAPGPVISMSSYESTCAAPEARNSTGDNISSMRTDLLSLPYAHRYCSLFDGFDSGYSNWKIKPEKS